MNIRPYSSEGSGVGEGNLLRIRDELLAKPHIIFYLFLNLFNKFNNT